MNDIIGTWILPKSWPQYGSQSYENDIIQVSPKWCFVLNNNKSFQNIASLYAKYLLVYKDHKTYQTIAEFYLSINSSKKNI